MEIEHVIGVSMHVISNIIFSSTSTASKGIFISATLFLNLIKLRQNWLHQGSVPEN